MHRWSKCKNFKRAFLCNLYIFVLFLLLRTTEIRKKCNNRIVKLFRKKRLGLGVCLSLVTRILKRTHLASLLGSCSKFEMLQMLIHLMPDSLSIFVVVCWLCLASNRLCCVISEIMLRHILSYITLNFFPTNQNDELIFLVVWARLPKCKSHFFYP